MSAAKNRPRSAIVVAMDRRESGMLLAALAELPFKKVYQLIGNLNAQAHAQFGDRSAPGDALPFRFEPVEWEFCLGVLQSLPYRDVHRLLERIGRRDPSGQASADGR